MKRTKIHRPPPARRYKNLFMISVEGSKTEPEYFKNMNSLQSSNYIKVLTHGKNSSPSSVLSCMKRGLKQENLKPSDEAWLVVDKDQWADSQLDEIYQWSQTKKNHGFALTNPCFEYWLLLHFEEGNSINTCRDCSNRLRKYLPNYNKNAPIQKFSLENITQALSRAKTRDQPPCEKWPEISGQSTVYKLIEKILN